MVIHRFGHQEPPVICTRSRLSGHGPGNVLEMPEGVSRVGGGKLAWLGPTNSKQASDKLPGNSLCLLPHL